MNLTIHPTEKLMLLAQFYVGVTEEGGDNRGAVVEAFQKAVDGKASGEPWCMAFQQFLLKSVEDVFGVKTPVARSESCLQVWHNTPPGLKSTYPRKGAWVIWQHGDGPTGHVELVIDLDPTQTPTVLTTIGGNTSNGDPTVIDREGDGVFVRYRRVQDTPTMKILGYIKPFALI